MHELFQSISGKLASPAIHRSELGWLDQIWLSCLHSYSKYTLSLEGGR